MENDSCKSPTTEWLNSYIKYLLSSSIACSFNNNFNSSNIFYESDILPDFFYFLIFLYLIIQPLSGLGLCPFNFFPYISDILFTFKSFGFDLSVKTSNDSINVFRHEKITELKIGIFNYKRRIYCG